MPSGEGGNHTGQIFKKAAAYADRNKLDVSFESTGYGMIDSVLRILTVVLYRMLTHAALPRYRAA